MANIKNIAITVKGMPMFAKNLQNRFGRANLSSKRKPCVVRSIRIGP